MKTYIAESQIDNMVTDLVFDAVDDLHAGLIAEKNGWTLVGELLQEIPCPEVITAVWEAQGATIH
jgi:hypothetical protein